MGLADDIINGNYRASVTSKKKKKEEESLADQIVAGTYRARLTTPSEEELDDIAPVKKQEEDTNWFSDGYDFGDITKTILGTVGNIGNFLDKQVIEPIGDFGQNYKFGKLTEDLGMEAYKKMMGEDNKYDEFKREYDEFLAKKPELINDAQLLDQTIQTLPNQVGALMSGIKGGGIGAAIGATAGGIIGGAGAAVGTGGTGTAAGATAGATTGAKILGGTGYVAGSADYTYKLEAGLQYQTLIEMGVPEDIAKEESKDTGAINALIEGGESILDLVTLGGVSAIKGVLTKGLVKKYGEKTVAKWVGENIVKNAVSEGIEEAAQESVSIHNEKQAMEQAGLERDDSQDAKRVVQSGIAGGFAGGIIGGGTSVITGTTKAGINTIQNKNQAQIQGLQQEIAKKQEELNNSQDAREKQIIQETINGLNEELNELTNAQQITDESELKKQNFTYEAKENDSDIRKAVYESASKVMNNTETTHKFVDVVAKIAEERGTTYKFTNNEQLKELGYAKEGMIVNGLVNENGEVLINIDRAEYINTVLGHETTHLLEGTKEYDALKQVAIEYAKSKGDYDARIERLTKLYEGTNADIEAELTSDIVGEYLFTDENFVKELSVKQPTIFEKIRNFISDLVVKFTGTDQEKQLRQLQRTFEKAYKAQGTQTTDTKYSVSNNINITDEINDYYSGETLSTMSAKVDGKVAGTLEYGEYEGKPNVKMIEVKPEYRRQGIATKLLQELQKKYPDQEIDFGMSTEDGTKLLKNITYQVENKEYTKTQKQLEKVNNRINEIETNNVWDDDIDTEYYKLLDKQRELDKKLFNLEVDGQNAKKTFIKLDESTTDNQGRTLTKEQQEYFKDSKVRDENGNLQIVFHSTPNKFTVFDRSRLGDNTIVSGNTAFGHFVTTNKEFSERFYDIDEKGQTGNVMELYANVTNPITHPYMAEYKYSGEELDNIVRNYYEATDNQDAITYLENTMEEEELDSLYEAYRYVSTDFDIDPYESSKTDYEILRKKGYDAVEIVEGIERNLIENSNSDKAVVSYAVFESNQLKDINNTNPTENPDINLSLSAQNEEIAPTGQWNVRGEDIKLQVEEAIAPLQEKIESLTEQLETVVNSNKQPTMAEEITNLMNIKETQSGSDYARAFFDLRDKYGQRKLYKALNEYYATGTVTEPNEFDNLAPTNQDIVEKQGQEAFNHITDEQAPSFEDAVFDAMDSGDFEYSSTEHIPSPLDSRDIDEVGNRKVKAYQYENPEVKPFFQAEAQMMLYDLDNTIKGEKGVARDELGNMEYYGITRQTTEAIAYLKDNYGYSYEQIRQGLNKIIEDDGKENNAVSKRIEFMLDERLREGYTTSDGYPIPPNEEYINFLNEKQVTEYNKEAFNALTDADVPLEQATMNTEPELKASEQVIPQQTKTAQKGNLKDTSVETQQEEKIAEIMAEAPTPKNRKQRQWAKFVMNFVSKGSPFEDLSLKTKNRELMGKWDSMLTSAAKAQNTMLNGIRKIDALNNVEEQVSKSLDDIRTKVVNSGKVQEFYEYMYHSLNTDRMSLESKAQAKMAQIKETSLKKYDDETIEELSRKRITDKTNEKTAELIESAKEYIRLREVKNKPVFGDSVTAEASQKAVEEFEMANPEFTEWAKDVYQYNNALRDLMVENNIISQETADLFAEMYPHYVPIKRIDTMGNAINVPLDTNRTSINTPIKRAKGGNQDILPMFDTMASRTLQTYKAISKNNFGIELKNTLKSTIDNQQTNLDEILDNVDQQESLLQEGKNGQAPTFTVFENGNKVTYEITQDMYDALKPISDSSLLSETNKTANFISNFHRGVLTEYNPVFMLTNALKDAQDILMNSQHAAKTYAKLGEAYAQILKKGMWYKEYMANGGDQNSYFDSQDNTYGKERIADKILPLKAISKLNNFIELSPRLAEYIASRESGRSIETSMLDAARVTTNFKDGGDVTKWLNRNGATFLNASVQGVAQQVRNVREAHSNGIKGYANLATKFALAGVPAMILNGLLWEDDEEYEELSDYVKTNYWIVGKYGDGNFIRIPKGRMITVIQESFNQMKHLITGDEQADLNNFLEVLGNNIAPNNPVSDNILSPIVQAVTNKTWYGGDLVPTRLQDVPAEEQYDESIDKLSIGIGQATGISPYKINYVLDQYSGGIGDIFLPMMTQQAEGGNDDLASNLLAPLVNKFTVDSTMKNQSVSDLYDLSDKLTTKANSSKATDEDVLKDKYLNAVKTEMNELYKEKREIQNSDLPDSEKYEQVRDIQKQINEMAKEATSSYEDISVNSNYSSVADKEYYKNNKGEWTKVRDEEAAELSELGMTESAKNTYFKTKNSISKIVGVVKDSKDSITIDDEDSEEYKEAVKYLNSEKKADIVDKIINSGLKDSEKAYLYKKFYNSDTIDTMIETGISVDDYLVYTTKEFKADYNDKGNAISGSRKNKVINYVNTLDMDIPQKAILIKSTNTFKFNDYNNAIVEYVGGLNIDYKDKVKILKDLDMTVDDEGNVYWE